MLEAPQRAQHVNVTRWFTTITGQSEWVAVAGAPQMCEKVLPFDSKKFAELQAAKKHAEGGAAGEEGVLLYCTPFVTLDNEQANWEMGKSILK